MHPDPPPTRPRQPVAIAEPEILDAGRVARPAFVTGQPNSKVAHPVSDANIDGSSNLAGHSRAGALRV